MVQRAESRGQRNNILFVLLRPSPFACLPVGKALRPGQAGGLPC